MSAYRRTLHRCWWVGVLLSPLLLEKAAAAEIRAQAAVSSRQAYLGDSIVLQITVDLPGEGVPEVDAEPLENLNAEPLGQPSLAHSRSIINGVRSEKYSYQFQYRIVPTQVGVVRVPAITVRHGREVATTTPIDVQVIGPESQDFAIVELQASDRALYPGQAVTLTVSVLLRRLSHQDQELEADPISDRNPPHLKLAWLEGTDILKPSPTLGVPPDFVKGSLEQRAREDGPSFLVNDLFERTSISLFEPRRSQTAIRFDRSTVSRTGADGKEYSYYRYSLPLEYRASHSGTAGPLTVQFRGPVFTGVRRTARGFEGDSREIYAVSQPLTLSVLPVPKAGQPGTFTGGVGSFRIAASAQPAKVHVGDPITVTVRITGSGNLEEIEPPKLSVQEKWADNFKVYDETSPGRLDGNAKTFTLSVRPKNAEVTELPAIRMSYFNPKLKKYEDTYSERIPLEVSETTRLDSSSLVDSTESDSSSRNLEEVGGGILANYSGADLLKPHAPYAIRAWWWLGPYLGLPVVWLCIYAWHARSQRLQRNPAWRRAQNAYPHARDRLQAARNAEDPYAEIARAIGGYLADRLNLPAGERTPAEARHHTIALGASDPLADEVRELLEQCDCNRFAQRGDGASFDSMLETGRALLENLERSGRSGSRARSSEVALRMVLCILPWYQAAEPADRSEPAFNRAAVLDRANDAFEQGTRAVDPAKAIELFRQAIGEYEKVIGDGLHNGKVHYNLGNAYFRAGDVPRAILHYRLAQRLMPRDDQLASNLAFARSQVPDRIEMTETGRLVRQILVFHTAMSIRERMAWGAGMLAFAWLALFARIWIPRRSFTLSGMVLLLVSLILTVSAYAQLVRDEKYPIGVLVADDVQVRKGDADTYEAQFNRALGAGVEFRVISRRGNWLEIEMPDGKVGWIRTDQAALSG